MIELPAAHFGRRTKRTVEPDETVRVEVRLPAKTAHLLYEHARQSHRTLSSVTAEAINALEGEWQMSRRTRAGPQPP